MNDELVNRFLCRDEDAIAEAKEKYGAYCAYVARNLLRDELDAEECVNDALLSAWKSIPPNEPENLKTYLGKLTREAAIDRLRWNTAQKRYSGAELQPFDELEEVIGGGSVEDHAEAVDLARAISAFLRGIGETERKVFIRRYWYFDSIEVICLRFGFGKSKVKMTLKRTRDSLAEYLRKAGYLI